MYNLIEYRYHFSPFFLLPSRFHFEETMILDNLVVELAEDILVVVDKLQELSGYCTQVVLANGQARRNLQEKSELKHVKRTLDDLC